MVGFEYDYDGCEGGIVSLMVKIYMNYFMGLRYWIIWLFYLGNLFITTDITTEIFRLQKQNLPCFRSQFSSMSLECADGILIIANSRDIERNIMLPMIKDDNG